MHTIALTRKDELLPIRRPHGRKIKRWVKGYASLISPVSIHYVDLTVAIPKAMEGDLLQRLQPVKERVAHTGIQKCADQRAANGP